MRFTGFLKLLPLLIVTFLHTSAFGQNSEKSELQQVLITADHSISAKSSEGWNINNATYSGKRLLASDYLHNARSIHFKPDGKRMYAVGRGTENVAEFELTIHWDISTGRYVQEKDISNEVGSTNQGSNAHGLYINNSNGTDLYVFNRTEIWQYELTEPWNITTAEQTKYKDLSNIISRGHDIDFNSEGTILYVDDRNNRSVFQFSLSKPWDIESLKLEYSLDISDHEENVRGIELKPDGTQMYIMDTDRKEILQFDLSTSWEIESAVFSSAFNVSSQSDNPRGITWKPDGSTFYVTHASNSIVYQYYINTESDNNDDNDILLAPIQVSPNNNAEDVIQQPVFEWGPVENADAYNLHVTDKDQSSTVVNVEVFDTSYKMSDTLNYETLHQWRVLAIKNDEKGEWSQFREFTTAKSQNDNGNDDESEFPDSPVQLLPKNYEKKVSTNPATFEWSDVGADYYILHSNRTNPSEIQIDVIVEGTSYTTSSSLDPETIYHWRVRGVKDGVEGEWSQIWEFETTTTNEDPEFVEKKPELLSPEDRKTVNSTPVSFEWSSVDADEYILHISRENDEGNHVYYFQSDTEGITIRATSYTLPDEPLSNRGHAWRVRGVKDGVVGKWSSISKFETDSELVTGIDDERPMETGIYQNYPNPFNPSTQIEFTLSELQNVSLQVYDLTGRQVAVLVEGIKQAGRHTVTFNADRLASGVYFSRLITEKEIFTLKMILMK